MSMVDLQFGRSFSKRNGFGPTVVYPPYVQNETDEVSLGRRLQDILTSLCMAAVYIKNCIA